jgi:hypothetical protein
MRADRDKTGKATTVSDFRTADQIVAATKDKPGLYALEPAQLGSGFVKHLALLWGTTVVECTNTRTPACVRHTLEEFMAGCKRNGRFCYLFGPKLV